MREVGTIIENFSLLNQNGEMVNLSDIQGKKIIYFYPKDSTPGCTLEANSFNSILDELKKLNTTVIGISKDSVKSHKNFECKNDLKFTLLSDEELNVLKYFDVWQEKKMCGKTYMGIVRQTYLLDENNKIIKTYEKVNTKNHHLEVLEDLKAL